MVKSTKKLMFLLLIPLSTADACSHGRNNKSNGPMAVTPTALDKNGENSKLLDQPVATTTQHKAILETLPPPPSEESKFPKKELKPQKLDEEEANDKRDHLNKVKVKHNHKKNERKRQENSDNQRDEESEEKDKWSKTFTIISPFQKPKIDITGFLRNPFVSQEGETKKTDKNRRNSGMHNN